MRFPIVQRILLAAALAGAVAQPMAAETLKIAFIDPLSGPFANAGESTLRHFRAAAQSESLKRRLKGVELEFVPFDNKASAQEALLQLRAAADRGIRFIVQGQSSAAALALVDAIEKHNERNPGREMLLLNYAALDPDLTNSKCSFWHFRFDAAVDMRMEALVGALPPGGRVKSVYLVGQDYSFGRHVLRAAREILARKRPDVRIAGEDLHPIGTVRDFTPYLVKIRAAGADAVITGNWGNDLTLLVKAARETGYQGDFYTFYGGGLGAVTAIGQAGAGRLKQVNEWHPNVAPGPGVDTARLAELQRYAQAYKRRHGEEYLYPRITTLLEMFAAALVRAGGPDPARIAFALEGMRLDTPTGEASMRAFDHQLIQPLYVSTLMPTAANGGPAGVLRDTENSGLGFLTDARVEGYATAQPSTCQMKRPRVAGS